MDNVGDAADGLVVGAVCRDIGDDCEVEAGAGEVEGEDLRAGADEGGLGL